MRCFERDIKKSIFLFAFWISFVVIIIVKWDLWILYPCPFQFTLYWNLYTFIWSILYRSPLGLFFEIHKFKQGIFCILPAFYHLIIQSLTLCQCHYFLQCTCKTVPQPLSVIDWTVLLLQRAYAVAALSFSTFSSISKCANRQHSL